MLPPILLTCSRPFHILHCTYLSEPTSVRVFHACSLCFLFTHLLSLPQDKGPDDVTYTGLYSYALPNHILFAVGFATIITLIYFFVSVWGHISYCIFLLLWLLDCYFSYSHHSCCFHRSICSCPLYSSHHPLCKMVH